MPDHSAVSYEVARSLNNPVVLAVPHGNDQERPCHRNRRCRLHEHPRLSLVRGLVTQPSRRRAAQVVRSIICAVLFAGAGCRQEQTRAPEYNEEEAKAQLAKLLEMFPIPAPDTPEQIREKEAKVEETLPQVYELLEKARTDPEKVDEVVELSMSLLTLVPGHRAAKVAYGRAQLAAFFASEATDPYNRAIAINSAVLEIDRLRENFDDLSEDEVQLCQDVYFNRVRLEGYSPHGTELEAFRDTIGKLMSVGFRDAERLRTEPRFAAFFADPKFAPVLQAAIAQIEASTEEDQSP